MQVTLKTEELYGLYKLPKRGTSLLLHINAVSFLYANHNILTHKLWNNKDIGAKESLLGESFPLYPGEF